MRILPETTARLTLGLPVSHLHANERRIAGRIARKINYVEVLARHATSHLLDSAYLGSPLKDGK